MEKYTKINTVYKRDENGRIIEGDFSIDEFDYLKDNLWVWTEKVDGTNIRVIWDGQRVRFGGRTDNAQIPAPLVDKLGELFIHSGRLEAMFSGKPVTLYGEGYGAGIQKGGGDYIADGVGFILFDVKIDTFWLQRQNVEDIARGLGVPVVPVVGVGTLLEAVELVRAGFQSQLKTTVPEGLVMKPLCEMFCRNGNRIIAKIKTRDFK